MKESIKIDITCFQKVTYDLCSFVVYHKLLYGNIMTKLFFGGKNKNRETTYCERDILQNMQRITKIETADL